RHRAQAASRISFAGRPIQLGRRHNPRGLSSRAMSCAACARGERAHLVISVNTGPSSVNQALPVSHPFQARGGHRERHGGDLLRLFSERVQLGTATGHLSFTWGDVVSYTLLILTPMTK